jgi:hypothetical protein
MNAPASDLSAAVTTFRTWDGKLNIVNIPDDQKREAVAGIEGVIVAATDQHRRWGRLKNDAYRSLGRYLRAIPRLKGRPKKESDADSLPSLADLGITDRRIAADALKVAAVPQHDYDDYHRDYDDPSLSGLLRYAKERRDERRAARDVDPEVQQREREIAERSRSAGRITSNRPSAVLRSLEMVLHPSTDPGQRTAAVEGVLKIEPEIAERIKAALTTPAPAEPAGRVFVSVPTWEQRIADRDAVIADYRKTIAKQRREIVKLHHANEALAQEVKDSKRETEDLKRENAALLASPAIGEQRYRHGRVQTADEATIEKIVHSLFNSDENLRQAAAAGFYNSLRAKRIAPSDIHITLNSDAVVRQHALIEMLTKQINELYLENVELKKHPHRGKKVAA